MALALGNEESNRKYGSKYELQLNWDAKFKELNIDEQSSFSERKVRSRYISSKILP